MTDLCPALQAPLSSRSMSVSSVDRAVDTVPFVVAIRLQSVKQTTPLARLRPPVESIGHGFPGPEVTWKVSPWDSRPTPPQDRLDEVAIVLRRPACSSLCREHGFDLRPLPIIELKSNHRAHGWSTSSTPWTVLAVCTAISLPKERPDFHSPLALVTCPCPCRCPISFSSSHNLRTRPS